MPHVVVLVHGMGSHEANWSDAALTVLKGAFAEYKNLRENFEFEDALTTVEVVYSNEFEQLRDLWKRDIDAFKKAAVDDLDSKDSAAKAEIENKLDEIATWGGAGNDSFATTHALDVILYRFFKTIRHNVNVQVANQIHEAVHKDESFQNWSIVAHSLGTAVAHNALNAIYGTTFPDSLRLRPQETRPHVLAMVANVSRVLQLPGHAVYDSRVKPGSVIANRCCGTYLNIRHRLDPFTAPKPFDPDLWPDATTFNSPKYQSIRPSHLVIDTLTDVHSLDHYLKNPRVHVPLLRGMLGADLIDDEEFVEKKTNFDSETATASVEVIRDELEELIPPSTASWPAMIDTLKRLRE